jgi:hypothetical protein
VCYFLKLIAWANVEAGELGKITGEHPGAHKGTLFSISLTSTVSFVLFPGVFSDNVHPV